MPVLDTTQIRNGMWVRIGDRVAIAQDVKPKLGIAAAHLVDDQSGTSLLVLPSVPLSDMTQARKRDIPECRRPNDIVARRFGYL